MLSLVSCWRQFIVSSPERLLGAFLFAKNHSTKRENAAKGTAMSP